MIVRTFNNPDVDLVEVEYESCLFHLFVVEGRIVKNKMLFTTPTKSKPSKTTIIPNPTPQTLYKLFFLGGIDEREWKIRRKLSEKLKTKVMIGVEDRGICSCISYIQIRGMICRKKLIIHRDMNKRIKNPLLSSTIHSHHSFLPATKREITMIRVISVSSIVFGMDLTEEQKLVLLR